MKILIIGSISLERYSEKKVYCIDFGKVSLDIFGKEFILYKLLSWNDCTFCSQFFLSMKFMVFFSNKGKKSFKSISLICFVRFSVDFR